MSTEDRFSSSDKSQNLDVAKLTVELCVMTGCDQDLAMMQLMNCDYDLQLAANKILESTSNKKQIDDGWQTINRQKKSKKKETKIEGGDCNDDSVKKSVSNRNTKFTNSKSNQKPGNFKNDDRQNYVRSRNKKNRSIRKSKDALESQNNNNPTNDSDVGFDMNDEELRWDNLADIDGGLKESGTNSVVDCFYSDDDFGFPPQQSNEAYQEIGIQLITDVNNMFKLNINNENNSKLSDKQPKIVNEPSISQSNSADTKFLDDCLTHQLPIFGKYSKTKLPKSLPIVPNKPVSFAIQIRSRNIYSKFNYNFGVNFLELLQPSNSVDKSISNSNQFDSDNIILLNQLTKQILSPNNPNFNNIVMHSGLNSKTDVVEILGTIYQQQKEVAFLLGKQHQTQSHYSFGKPINLISNSNSMYPMQMNPENLHAEIENVLTHQDQECFIQNSFPTSISMSVPFHLPRK